ncbi:MAG TPA: ABC transporter substrate-binding protein [Casimicrobiaceae bacterium]|nr:ABC transporter substrate-binding protein [Casimicrobiaceae bacterium]
MRQHHRFLAAMTFAVAFGAGVAQAATFRFADQGDAISMDPHSLNETLQLNVTGNMYEPLVGRGKKLELIPLLAASWKQTAPTIWRFNLRQGVKFHDGSPFSADDVLFSYERSKAEGSDMKTKIGSLKEIRKVDEHTVEFVTNTPFPILPDTLTTWYIMSKAWCEKNNSMEPVDVRKGKENAATMRVNGTGPFMLKSREPGVRTVMVPNPGYWGGKIDSNITEAIFTPIKNDATRVAALVSGEIDMMEPVPLQDVDKLKTNPNIVVLQGPELRTIFLGMDQSRDELLFSNVKGKNPFKDKRVRQAFYQAIDEAAIAKTIMRGAATPSGLMVAPGIRGFAVDLYPRLPYDAAAAKKLLADAGYPNGFEVGMNCPNDRYVNDASICQAVAAMLAKIDVKVNLMAETKVTYFPKILARNTSFYMLGWTPDSYDSQNAIYALMTTSAAGGAGLFNLGSYSNKRVDELGAQIASELDDAKRNAMIHELFKIHEDDIGHIPLHQQALAWATRKNIDLVQLADNTNWLKWVVVK